MRIIGVTGGVGAGKSAVLDYLEEHYGALRIEADQVGHEVMEPGAIAYDPVLAAFGQDIVSPDGKIDRKALGNMVFADEEKRLLLNSIIHPAVKREILRRLHEAERKGETLAVVEAALFLEEHYEAFCDETWYIYTKEENRRQRLRESRGYSEKRIDALLHSQRTHEEFLARCDRVIDNNGSVEETRRQVDAVLQQRN
ncbi:MAG: dephospho-CoA kinase [Lachnospiraceae bacterium]|nr:dephospho-CoA kinase [Lachnospiraceae bacterium]